MANDIAEMILDQVDDNLIHEAGRDAGEAIAKAIGRQPEDLHITPEDFSDRVVEVLTHGHGMAANAFTAGIAAGLKEHYQQLQTHDTYL